MALDVYSSVIYAFIVLYFVQFWSSPPFSGRFSVYEYMSHNLYNLMHLTDYEVNTNYRYVFSSAANVLLFSNIVFALRAVNRATFLNTVLLLVSALTMLFTYPSHTVIAGVFMLSCFIHLCWKRDLRTMYVFLGIGIIALLFLVVIDYPSFLKATYYNSSFLKEVHPDFKRGTALKSISFNLILHAIINKYSITYLAFIYFFRDKLYGNILLLFYFGLMLVASATSFVASDLIASRFTRSGIDILWAFGFVCVLGGLIQQALSYIQSQSLKKGIIITLCAPFIIVPTIGFAYFTNANLTNNSCYYPAGQAEAVQWAASHLKKNEVIAALDFTDAHFLTYAGNYTNFISYGETQRLTSEQSLVRYIALAKLCQMTRSEFSELIKDSLIAPSMVDYGGRPLPTRPFIKDTKEFQSSQFATMLIYWPCISKVWGIDIGTKGYRLTEEFESKLMDTFNRLDLKSYFSQYPLDYIFISFEHYKHIAMKLKLVYPVIFENDHGTIFKVSKI